MTLIAVPIFVERAEDVSRALARAATAVAGGARLIEWRVDVLAEAPDAANAVRRLVRDCPAPCLVTCRPTWEGGGFDGEERTRVALLEALVESGDLPRYVDVELAAYRRDRFAEVARGFGETGLILSTHDFEGRPADLIQRVETIATDEDAAVVKVAWRARSIRDNLEAFDLLAERRKPTIALCMDEFGLPSRVLAGKFGGFLTFAAPEADEASAPGQPTLDELRSLYRFDDIGPDTRVYGVVGWPVAHSRGPHLHNAGFGAVGHDGVYLPLPVPPEWEHFKASVGALVDHDGLDFAGASVTLPHKEHLVRFVTERGGTVDRIAARLGAANTLVVGDDGALSCTNTDAPAAVEALDADAGSRIAVLGAGGVARAVAGGLADAGMRVTVFNRTADRAAALADDLGAGIEAAGLDELAGGFDAYVNCTPVGMEGGPDPDGSPLPESVTLDECATVFDTVYTPARTPLVRKAEARGSRVVSGAEMFVRQAAAQFAMWTGQAGPLALFRETLSA
ncbi:MAG: type I 3-dehydroquinate dehydratase [Planctomycetota bacterium]|jgi:3-dehydroquinate dehydratase/shikimate dehydrogenase